MPERVFDLEASAAMPAVNRTMREINEALQDKTMADFVLYRPLLVEGLRSCLMPNKTLPRKTMNELSEDKDAVYTKLMLAMPRGVALSAVRHTVAYDYAPRTRPTTRPDPPLTYSGDYKGVYAVSIAIGGRDGKFLTPKEFRTLIKGIDDYRSACEHFQEAGEMWPPGPTAAGHRAFIHAVDTTYNTAEPGDVPRWGKTGAAVRNICALKDMMSRYLRVPDLPDDEPIKQSPVMVGCTTTSMKKRCEKHLPQSGMGSTTHTWALTLSLLRYMGLSPVVVSIPVLVTIEPNTVAMGERLVTTLAQSHIGQLGYNIAEGGGKGDNGQLSEDLLLEMQWHVYMDCGWVGEQSRAAYAELQRRQELGAKLSHIVKTEYKVLLADKDRAGIAAVRRRDFKQAFAAVESAFNRLTLNIQKGHERLSKVEKDLEEQLNCRDAVDILIRVMGLEDDTDNTGEKMGNAGEKAGNAGEKTGNAGE